MALRISPRENLDAMVVGEEVAHSISIIKELDGRTVDTCTYKIYDKDDSEVTTNFSGGSTESNGVITFGIKGYAVGKYKLEFWVTCVEMIPDGTTPYEFTFEMSVIVEA